MTADELKSMTPLQKNKTERKYVIKKKKKRVYYFQTMSSFMDGSRDAYLASLADFAGADDIITNLAEKREPGTEISESTP